MPALGFRHGDRAIAMQLDGVLQQQSDGSAA